MQRKKFRSIVIKTAFVTMEEQFRNLVSISFRLPIETHVANRQAPFYK